MRRFLLFRDKHNADMITARERAMADSRDLIPLLKGQQQAVDGQGPSGSKSLISKCALAHRFLSNALPFSSVNVRGVTVESNKKSMEELKTSSGSCPDLLLKGEQAQRDQTEVDLEDDHEHTVGQNLTRRQNPEVVNAEGVNVTVKVSS